MSVTCKWEYKLGSATKVIITPDADYKYEISFYGGGNCLFVACYEENKNLYTFASDRKHAKSFLTDMSLDLKDVKIYVHPDKSVNKQCKDLAKLFVDLGITFSLVYKE